MISITGYSPEVQAFLVAEIKEIERRFFKPTRRGGVMRYLGFREVDNRDRRVRKRQPHDPQLTRRIRRDIEEA